MEFLMRHVHIMVIVQGECCKTYGLYSRRKGEGEIWILVFFVCGHLPKIICLGRTIYMWELYIVITNIERNKE
jgi:hypothetical protein